MGFRGDFRPAGTEPYGSYRELLWLDVSGHPRASKGDLLPVAVVGLLAGRLLDRLWLGSLFSGVRRWVRPKSMCNVSISGNFWLSVSPMTFLVPPRSLLFSEGFSSDGRLA